MITKTLVIIWWLWWWFPIMIKNHLMKFLSNLQINFHQLDWSSKLMIMLVKQPETSGKAAIFFITMNLLSIFITKWEDSITGSRLTCQKKVPFLITILRDKLYNKLISMFQIWLDLGNPGLSSVVSYKTYTLLVGWTCILVSPPLVTMPSLVLPLIKTKETAKSAQNSLKQSTRSSKNDTC